MECLVHVKNVGVYMIWAHIYRTHYCRMLPWLYCESIAYPCIVIASKGKHLPGVYSVHVSHGKVISAHSFCKFYLLNTALYFGKLCLTSNLVSIPCSSSFYCCYIHANITNISLLPYNVCLPAPDGEGGDWKYNCYEMFSLCWLIWNWSELSTTSNVCNHCPTGSPGSHTKNMCTGNSLISSLGGQCLDRK